MKIKNIKFGTACRIGNTIYINNIFKKDIELYNFLIKHEQNHSKTLTMGDIKQDIRLFPNKNKQLKQRYMDYLKSNPSTWLEFLPILIYDGKIVFNTKLIFLYLFFGIIICVSRIFF